MWPSVNQEIQIVAPDLEYHVDYVGREDRASLIEYGKGAFRLSDTILPPQVLIVRWWPKTENEKATGEFSRSPTMRYRRPSRP
jgi:hypothetical protein